MFDGIIANLSAIDCILDSVKHCNLDVLNFDFGSSAGPSTVERFGRASITGQVFLFGHAFS